MDVAIQLDGIDSASVVQIKAGDTLVLMTDKQLSAEQAGAMRKELKSSVLVDVDVLVLDAGRKIAVLSR